MRKWSQYGDGDVQAVSLVGGTIYGGGHFTPQFGKVGSVAGVRNMIAAMDAATGALQPFDPVVAGSSGIWALLAEPSGLRIGGIFTSVNGDTTIRGFATFPVQAGATALVDAGAAWEHQADGADLGTAWREPGFDQTGWTSGLAQLGMGDGDEATTLPAGRVTYYFRHGFTVAADVTPSELSLSVVRDDGAVVYLNGIEVWRDNLPAGPVTASTRAVTAIAGADESAWQTVTIPATALQPGANVLAVEVHNNAPSSSDLSFDLRLSTA